MHLDIHECIHAYVFFLNNIVGCHTSRVPRDDLNFNLTKQYSSKIYIKHS